MGRRCGLPFAVGMVDRPRKLGEPGMCAAPTGTVTFLLSDIEGSTERWERRPAAMKAALLQHDSIVRTAIESHGGYIFKTVGDAFCSTFSSAHPALLAAIEAQRALAAARWGRQIGALSVRMALHT